MTKDSRTSAAKPQSIQAHTTGESLAEFERDWLRLGSQRALEIVSEACRHIPDELLNLAPDIPWKGAIVDGVD
ncbi:MULTISPECIES: DUF86 domain-containing protein [Neorhizobium]|jgi:uncharacterized protein with HEPN domain|uniref:HepT-like ribonuclease domain-containing protein n=1 Tax=Neorhizobium sp. T6_25 TaxID=2093833 RepID=UPI00197B1735|nr:MULTISPECIES: hypothetical protein [Neorhizobium]